MADTTGEDELGGADTTGTGPTRGVDSDGGGDSNILAVIRNGNLRAFLMFFGLGAATVDMLAGETGLLTSPREFIIQVVIDWLYNGFIRPIAVSLWQGGFAVIDGLALVFFGGDYSIGHPGTTSVGVFDVPFLVTRPLGLGYIGIGESISSGIEAVNQPFISAMSTLGIAAPFAATLVIVFELFVASWALWTVINSIDVPGVRIMSAAKAALRPLTNLLRWLFT